jgi:hypothetical protein
MDRKRLVQSGRISAAILGLCALIYSSSELSCLIWIFMHTPHEGYSLEWYQRYPAWTFPLEMSFVVIGGLLACYYLIRLFSKILRRATKGSSGEQGGES